MKFIHYFSSEEEANAAQDGLQKPYIVAINDKLKYGQPECFVAVYDIKSLSQKRIYKSGKPQKIFIDGKEVEIKNEFTPEHLGETGIKIYVNRAEGMVFDGDDLKSLRFPGHTIHIPSEVCRGAGELESVVLPKTARTIGDYAFFDCKKLTSITLPMEITSIGEYAFFRCGITSVVLPESVKEIKHCAFTENKIQSIRIPASVTSIGSNVFLDTSLKKAEFASLESLLKISFKDHSSNPLYVAKNLWIDGAKVTEITIPNGIKRINDYTFCGGNIISCTFPDGLERIGNSAFLRSTIENLELPSTLVSIGDDAFWNCYKLDSITIPDSVKKIGNEAFSYCNSVGEVYISSNTVEIGFDAFSELMEKGNLYFKSINGDAPSEELLEQFVGWTLYINGEEVGEITKEASGSYYY